MLTPLKSVIWLNIWIEQQVISFSSDLRQTKGGRSWMALGQWKKTIYRLLTQERARVHMVPPRVTFILSTGMPQRDGSSLGFKDCLCGAGEESTPRCLTQCCSTARKTRPGTPSTESWVLYSTKKANGAFPWNIFPHSFLLWATTLFR